MVNSKLDLNKTDYISLALLFVLSFFLFADQNLMGPNLTLIAQEFNIMDEKDQLLRSIVRQIFHQPSPSKSSSRKSSFSAFMEAV